MERAMKLTMLGTGHAVVTRCFNTCFLTDDGGKLFLTDTGGGSMLLNRITEAGYHWGDIHDIFISHRHTDHLLGVFWMIRMGLSSRGRRPVQGSGQESETAGEPEHLRIYSHAEVINIIRQTTMLLFTERQLAFLDNGVDLITVEDGEEREICGRKFTFFDTHSTKDTQFGYCMDLGGGEKLTFCGDEPLQPVCYPRGENAAWLLHESFCLEPAPGTLFDPKKIGHSRVSDACKTAEELHVKNLILYHTEDSDLSNRKRLYTEEGRKYYSGNLLVPDDLETIELT